MEVPKEKAGSRNCCPPDSAHGKACVNRQNDLSLSFCFQKEKRKKRTVEFLLSDRSSRFFSFSSSPSTYIFCLSRCCARLLSQAHNPFLRNNPCKQDRSIKIENNASFAFHLQIAPPIPSFSNSHHRHSSSSASASASAVSPHCRTWPDSHQREPHQAS